MKRILLAGILGGLGLFVWGGLSHMVLGLGEVGVRGLPQQQAVLDTLRASTPEAGFYYFPQPDSAMKLPADQIGGPHGILIFHPTGATLAMGGMLTKECILNIVQALILAFLLSLAPGLSGYMSRVGFVVLIGVLAGITTNVEYWIWYGFPSKYTAGIVSDRIVGFLIVGLVAAALVKPAAAKMQVVTAKAA